MEEILSFFGDTKHEIETQRLRSVGLCTEFFCGSMICSNSVLNCLPVHSNE